MTDWHVGMKVVFIGKEAGATDFVKYGAVVFCVPQAIYTVRSVVDFGTEGLGICLAEVINSGGELECAFHVCQFRPVVELKYDISIFTAMLNTQPEKVDA